MFTGIIEQLLEVTEARTGPDGMKLALDFTHAEEKPALGDSVSINGVCLTASSIDGDSVSFDAVPESLSKTTLGTLAKGDRVNVELALKADARLGGHYVTGHVDAVGTVRSRRRQGKQELFTVGVAPETAGLLVDKGSVSVDGVSLTVVDAKKDSFTFAVIPHTIEKTTLSERKPGDRVNVEADILGKYVKKFLAPGAKQSTITKDFLGEHGFI